MRRKPRYERMGELMELLCWLRLALVLCMCVYVGEESVYIWVEDDWICVSGAFEDMRA